jgi:hypothetical protein
MLNKYVVRLTDDEREVCQQVIKKLKGTSQTVRRAQVLLKADADGPAWVDTKIAEVFGCRTRTIEMLRQRFVLEGFDVALHGQQRKTPPTAKLLNGEQEAKLIAMRLRKPPDVREGWKPPRTKTDCLRRKRQLLSGWIRF